MHTSSVKNFVHEQPVYYSLTFPTLTEGSPLKKGTSTVIADLRQLKLLIETVKIPNANFEYFHTREDKYEKIMPSFEILESDPHFLQDETFAKNRTFCDCSAFFNGCIRISS